MRGCFHGQLYRSDNRKGRSGILNDKIYDRMKRVILFICLAVWVLPLAAQIDFRESGFAKALEAAKVENKLVFMDCYTSWCGPCKRMAAQEFTQEKAGEYFNPRFVSVKIDMEKGEGVELRKRYDVNAYPTLLVLNAEGELLCRHAGYLSVDKLIDFAENGVKGGGLTDMHKRYAAGERSVEFIRGYLAQLEEAARSGTMYTVANDYLQDKTDAVFTDAAIYAIFRDYAIPVNPVFQQVYARKAELAERYGEEAVRALDKRWEAFGSRYLKREGKKTVGYDAAGLEAYYTLMKECGVPEAEALRAIVLLDGASGAQEWRVLLEAMVVYSRFSRMTEDHLFYGQKEWQNADERKKFAALLEKRVKALKGKKDTSGRTMTVGGKRMPIMEYYCQSYEKMLEKVK